MSSGARRPFLTAEWRYLAMLNYEVDPAILAPRVPAGTELDLWQGAAIVSMVGFRFLDTRVLGLGVPWHRDFDEVNLRFYVRRRGEDGAWRRGVVFVKEIVPRVAIAAVARLVYNEPYVALPMRHEIALEDGGPRSVSYEWRSRGRWDRLAVRVEGALAPIAAGSEEEFITEHYWGYTARRDGGCMEYAVEHPRWSVWPVAEAALECEVAALYGPAFAGHLAGPPRSALLADGSAVAVYPGARIA